MSHLVFLKLGGAAITDKSRDSSARLDVIRDLGREIQHAFSADPSLQLLLGHGSGSFGHFAARRSGFEEVGNWGAYAETGAAAARLNRLVADILLEQGIPVVSFQPSASARCSDGELVSLAVEPIQAALVHRLVPLVYGDVAFDETWGKCIASTEMIFAYLALKLRPSRIVYVSQVDGIYTADPLVDPRAQRIPEITPSSFKQIRPAVGGSRGVDVTGGMLDKLRRNLKLVEKLKNLDIYVVGPDPRPIAGLLLDKRSEWGTHIHAG